MEPGQSRIEEDGCSSSAQRPQAPPRYAGMALMRPLVSAGGPYTPQGNPQPQFVDHSGGYRQCSP
jgi:hypothetical protein